MALKLYYFDIPARAEATRLILTYGGVEFEDIRIKREQWPELKPKTPFGQLPVLETPDGVRIAQSHALERYAGSLSGLIPEEPVQVALAEQAAYQMDDIAQLFSPTYKLDADAKITARQELLKGAVGVKLGQLAKLLEGKKYLLGDDLSYVDFVLFAGLSHLKSGFLDGIPPNYLDDHPVLKEFHSRIASLDKVKAYYAGKTGFYEAFSA